MPTLGRTEEVFEYIKSVEKSSELVDYSLSLYIIDQNNGLLLNELDDYQFHNITGHVSKNKVKGLSANRNRGLYFIDSGICAFPDDDCLYYEDTVECVVNYFEQNLDVDVVIGRIFDREKKENIIKNWPNEEVVVNMANFYQLSSSITIFLREKPDILFDERLGAGAKFGSCEDPDFLYRLLKNGMKIVYTPTIEVWHPAPDESSISLDKVKSYSSGFGAFIRKDLDFIKSYLLLGCLAKKGFQFLFMNNKFRKGYFKAFFSGLFRGLTQF